jgi:hypothetical protein
MNIICKWCDSKAGWICYECSLTYCCRHGSEKEDPCGRQCCVITDDDVDCGVCYACFYRKSNIISKKDLKFPDKVKKLSNRI